MKSPEGEDSSDPRRDFEQRIRERSERGRWSTGRLSWPARVPPSRTLSAGPDVGGGSPRCLSSFDACLLDPGRSGRSRCAHGFTSRFLEFPCPTRRSGQDVDGYVAPRAARVRDRMGRSTPCRNDVSAGPGSRSWTAGSGLPGPGGRIDLAARRRLRSRRRTALFRARTGQARRLCGIVGLRPRRPDPGVVRPRLDGRLWSVGRQGRALRTHRGRTWLRRCRIPRGSSTRRSLPTAGCSSRWGSMP